MSRYLLIVWLAGMLVACSTTTEPTTEDTVPSTDPEIVMERFLAAVADDDFEEAARLTDVRQVTLLAVAEGIASSDVAAFTPVDRHSVLVNFWEGFVSQLRASLGSSIEGMRDGDIERSSAGGASFAGTDLVRSSDGSQRNLVLRHTDEGWRLDLIASFPQAFLVLLPDVAQAVRASGDPTLIGDLRGYGASIEHILAQPDMDPVLEQAAIAALEATVR